MVEFLGRFGAQPGGFGEDDVNLHKVGPESIVTNGVIFGPYKWSYNTTYNWISW